MRVLVIGAHPDDEVLGCGGAIIKHVEAGDVVTVMIITEATPELVGRGIEKYNREKLKQQLDVDNVLGVDKRFNLNYPTIQLNVIPHGILSQRINTIAKGLKPDVVYTHFLEDLNLDHDIVCRASLVACRDVKKILMYEIISSTDLSVSSFKPNHYVSFGKNVLKRKINAYKCYVQESKKKSRSIQRVEVKAKARGLEISVNYAEAFQLVKEVI